VEKNSPAQSGIELLITLPAACLSGYLKKEIGHFKAHQIGKVSRIKMYQSEWIFP
jgi:hypothetical protein